jgi:hypothetical protein
MCCATPHNIHITCTSNESAHDKPAFELSHVTTQQWNGEKARNLPTRCS